MGNRHEALASLVGALNGLKLNPQDDSEYRERLNTLFFGAVEQLENDFSKPEPVAKPRSEPVGSFQESSDVDLSNCPRCGNSAKQVPAGTSKKTGRPYRAFYVCTYGCKSDMDPSRDLSWGNQGAWIAQRDAAA